MKQRVIFGNLAIYSDKNIVLLNLMNFRRKVISASDFDVLMIIDEKNKNGDSLSSLEKELYETLLSQKQILLPELISKADTLRENTLKNSIQKTIKDFTISPTFDCNFKCKYCYQRNFDKNIGTMTTNHIDNIYDLLINYHKKINEKFEPRFIGINGGEALLEKNISIINYVLNKFSDCPEFKLYTNGINILKYSKQLDFSRFNKVQVSLDGYDDLIHLVNNYHTPAFDTITQGIAYLSDLGVEVTVICMLTKEIIDNLDKFIEQLRQRSLINKKNVRISFSYVSDFGKPECLDNDFLSLENFLDLRYKLAGLINDTNIQLDRLFEVRWIGRALTRNINEKMWGRESTCGIMESRPIIFAPNGKIYWCSCVDPNQGIMGEYFPKMDFDERNLLQYLQRNVFKTEECKKCDFRYVCSGGCVLYNIKQGKPIDTPNCGFFKNQYFLDNLEKFL